MEHRLRLMRGRFVLKLLSRWTQRGRGEGLAADDNNENNHSIMTKTNGQKRMRRPTHETGITNFQMNQILEAEEKEEEKSGNGLKEKEEKGD